jgi:effector-binding domain-containing protein
MKRLLFGIVLYSVFIVCTSLSSQLSFFEPVLAKKILKDTSVKIEIEQTAITDMKILFITDTAITTSNIKDVWGKGYEEIMLFIHQNGLEPKKFLAWYKTYQQPWLMDVAAEVNEIPQELSGRIHSKVIPGGEVVIAHMWGPYNQVGKAYSAIEQWLKTNNRKAKSAPFEVYVNDPNTVKSPAEIQTDIYQPIE